MSGSLERGVAPQPFRSVWETTRTGGPELSAYTLYQPALVTRLTTSVFAGHDPGTRRGSRPFRPASGEEEAPG